VKLPRCRLCGHEHRLGGEHVFEEAVANAVANKESARVARWREGNRARYNERQAKLMRGRRAVVVS